MNKNIFYNSHHSPVGAFASFTLGFKGASGGLGTELSGPAGQNVYIGIESAAAGRFLSLPFYKDNGDQQTGSNIPDGGASRQDSAVIRKIGDGEITREFSPACDIWRAGDLEFRIYTPFLPIPDPNNADPQEIKKAVVPAVFVELSLDNARHSRPRKAFFGYEGNDPYSAMRRVDDAAANGDVIPEIKGVGQGRITGIFTDDAAADCALAFSAGELLADDIADRLQFGLGTAGLVLMTAGANEKRTWRFVVCFYRDGVVTVGKKASYLYTRYFNDIEDVARYGLANFDLYKQAAMSFDKAVLKNRLTGDRQFLLSQSIKSYYGSTQLLVDETDEPLWIVNEGGYRMINTLDLAVDHLFFEMRMNPWVVRSVLDQFVIDYCYYDDVQDASGRKFPGGISFAHDMGVANVFSARGASSYELSNLKGCYSYMAQEQLANWILYAAAYWSGSGDDVWLDEHCRVIEECLESMVNRDGVDDISRDGVMDLDSCKTGAGAEITTYDNVDKALGRARRNSYLAVKCWAAYLSLEKMFDALGLPDPAKVSSDQAAKCAATVLKYKRADGTIPAILDGGNEALALAAVEGLIYPYVTGMFDESRFISKYSEFIDALKTHFKAALSNGCKFSDGSWKMSLTSDNSWLSKTFLFQFIAEKIFGFDIDEQADRIHASWLLDPGNAGLAFSDQMKAGKICGSPYYPRGVTSILWVV
jgi:hypothetical protein